MTKYGMWIRTQTDKTHYKYACSNCKQSSRFYKFPFCPFCGLEMDLTATLNQKGKINER